MEEKCMNCGGVLTKTPFRVKRAKSEGEEIVLSKGVEYKQLNICNGCTKKIVPRPTKDESGKFIWWNLLTMDIKSFFMLVLILGMAFAYQADTAKCDEAVTNPCTFCATTGCYNPETKCSNVNIPDYKNVQISNGIKVPQSTG